MPDTVRERAMAEIVRKFEAHEYNTVSFDRITRDDIPDDYNASEGSVLALVEGSETFEVTGGSRSENTLDLYATFAVPLADGEVRQTVANNVAGEIITALSGNHQLKEGGDGTPLTCAIYARSIQPDELDEQEAVASATVVFEIKYRARSHAPGALQ